MATTITGPVRLMVWENPDLIQSQQTGFAIGKLVCNKEFPTAEEASGFYHSQFGLGHNGHLEDPSTGRPVHTFQ